MMEPDKKGGFWVPAEAIGDFLASAGEVILTLLRPMTGFIRDVSASSWLGMCVVFSMFFAVFLIRAGARAGKDNRGTFSEAMDYYAGWGLRGSVAFLVVLAVEWMVVPVVTLLGTATVNSITGQEPGLRQFSGFLFTASPERSAFLADVAGFYGQANTSLPLSFNLAAVIAVGFVTMRLVARGMAKLQS